MFFKLLLFYVMVVLSVVFVFCGISFTSDQYISKDFDEVFEQHYRAKGDKWPDGIVKYHLNKSLSVFDIVNIYEAFEEYHTKTCIRFQEKNDTDTNYVNIEFEANSCASADTCMKGGYQFVKIGDVDESCRNKATIIHELGHTLCLIHEHQRSDRDNNVIIHKYDYCPERNVKKHTSTKYIDRGFYDYSSIMHYDCGELECLDSIDPLVKGCGDQVSKGLSVLDVDYLNELYNCSACKRHRWIPYSEIGRKQIGYAVSTKNYFENGTIVFVKPCRTALHGELLVGNFDNVSCKIFFGGVEQNVSENFEVLYLPFVTPLEDNLHVYKWKRLNELSSQEEVDEVLKHAVSGGYMHANEMKYFTTRFVAQGNIFYVNGVRHLNLPSKYGLNVFGTVSKKFQNILSDFSVDGKQVHLRDFSVLTCSPDVQLPSIPTIQCNCLEIVLEQSVCGRAYLKGGCRKCNTAYLELKKGKTNIFPSNVSGQIEAFRIRNECNVFIYSQNEFTGEETVLNLPVLEDFTGNVGSYKCECNHDPFVGNTDTLTFYPELVDIPVATDNVKWLFAQEKEKYHVGINAAIMSGWNRRSNKNAYILALGTRWSRKSACMELLFNHLNRKLDGLEKEVDLKKSITEYRIQVALDEIGIKNSELRLIDTPDLAGTLENDTELLGALEKYLSTHEELNERLPNIVLIFDTIASRVSYYSPESSPFIKTLRELDYFRNRITDQYYSNVVYVMSHVQLLPNDQSILDDWNREVNQVIHEFSMFPKPLHVIFADNRYLLQLHDSKKQTSRNYFPKNLLEKIDFITENCMDPIGLAVFRAALQSKNGFNVTILKNEICALGMVQTIETLKIANYIKDSVILNKFDGSDATSVSLRLQQVWNHQMKNEIKHYYPFSLAFLEKSLNSLHINAFKDIPRSTINQIKLISSLRKDYATKLLLEAGLGIHDPVFLKNMLVGYGYIAFKDQILNVSPLHLGNLQPSDIIYRLPDAVTCHVKNGIKDRFVAFLDKAAYMEYRLHELGINGKFPVHMFTDKVKSGYHLTSVSLSKPNFCFLRAKKEFYVFQLVLNQLIEPMVSSWFKSKIQMQEMWYPSNTSNAGFVPNRFFELFGTHIIQSVYGGGYIEIELGHNESTCRVHDVLRVAELLQDLNYNLHYAKNTSLISNEIQLLEKKEHFVIRFNGGDQTFRKSFNKMTLPEAKALVTDWRKSLRFNPSMLPTSVKLIPISKVAKQLGSQYSLQVENAIKHLYGFTYNHPEVLSKFGNKVKNTESNDGIIQAMQHQLEHVNDWVLQLKLADEKLAK